MAGDRRQLREEQIIQACVDLVADARVACDHIGAERVERVAHGYLGDAPAGTVEVLCVDCGGVVG